jgi:hypothetical protein
MNQRYLDHQYDTKTENWNVWGAAIMFSPQSRLPSLQRGGFRAPCGKTVKVY